MKQFVAWIGRHEARVQLAERIEAFALAAKRHDKEWRVWSDRGWVSCGLVSDRDGQLGTAARLFESFVVDTQVLAGVAYELAGMSRDLAFDRLPIPYGVGLQRDDLEALKSAMMVGYAGALALLATELSWKARWCMRVDGAC